nr:unnamed protein product [Digitaria exilis]
MSTRRLVLSLIYILLVAGHGAPHAAAAYTLSFAFDFSSTSTFSLTDFTTAGDAAFHGSLFDLTANSYSAGITFSVGRVAYAHPVQLRDNATGKANSFTTAFSFAISVTDENNKGDGMAFFLGNYPSKQPPNSQGGALGLCTGFCAKQTTGEDRFVAVEFDTFTNTWDPNRTYDHLGIDVNSIVSVSNVSLPIFSLNGTMSARVDYNGSTGVLNAELQFGPRPMFYGATPTYNVSAKVDLASVLPEQVAIGFSAATGSSIELHQLLSWSFSLVTPGSSATTSTSAGATASSGSRTGLKVALGITSAVSLLLCIAILGLLRALRRQHLAFAEIQLESEARSKLMDEEFEKGSGPKRFDHGQLAAATRDFSDEEKLGEGGFGAVQDRARAGIGAAVPPPGVGAVRGAQGHQAQRHHAGRLVQRQAGDFGLARLSDHGLGGSHTTNLAGTMGYMDPECFVTGRAGPESDVYSFGVVLLEVACGRPPVVLIGQQDEEQHQVVGRERLVEWVWGLYGGGAVVEAADERMGGDFDRGEVERVMVVGLACAHPDSTLRPTIRQAVSMLQSEVTLPTLPGKMPTPKYP